MTAGTPSAARASGQAEKNALPGNDRTTAISPEGRRDLGSHSPQSSKARYSPWLRKPTCRSTAVTFSSMVSDLDTALRIP